MTKRELLEQLWAKEREDPVSKIGQPTDILPALQKYSKRKQEEFIVITLDGAHNVIKIRSVTKGLVNSTVVHPREVFRPAIRDNAIAIIIAHNHPSGSLIPSVEDDRITRILREAGKILGIEILDHLIISSCGYHSYLENGGFPVISVNVS